MKTEVPGVDWLLDCQPRPAQLEALARSYTGVAYRDSRDQAPVARPLRSPGPARGWGHFLEMRVGKTPTLLNEFLLFRRDFGMRKLLVLGPNKYKATWGTEAVRFGVDVPGHVFQSSEKGRKAALAFVRANKEAMMFVNYEALIYPDNMKVLEEFVDSKTIVGMDESVLLKNKESQFWKNTKDLIVDAAATRPMSGKPVVQGAHDLFAQLKLARARELEGVTFVQFRNSYCLLGGFKGKAIIGVKNEHNLQKIIDKNGFFARRRDWATQIDSDFELRSLDMSPEQARHYQQMEEEFVTWLETGDSVSTDQVITKRMKMQQISSGFIIDEQGEAHQLLPPEKVPKLQDLLYTLENETTDKVIVIAHYRHSIATLQAALAKYNPAFIVGGSKDAEEQKYRFNNDPACRVMIGQEKAIKYGHTLMGTKEDPCLSIFYYENTYSLDDRSQTEQRPQGEGQQAPIRIVDWATSGVERDIIGALQRKEDVAATVMGYYGKS